jgi:cytidyltransferase-like protein
MPVALTVGTFDLPHIGHAKLFRRCEALGEVVVGVNTDEFVAAYKKFPPLYRTAERMAMIARLGYRVVENDGPGRQLIEQVNPDYLVVGSDWLRRGYLAQIDMTPDDLDRLDISLVFVPYFEGISSSDIKERLS